MEHGKKNSEQPERNTAPQGNLRLEEARAIYLPASLPPHHAWRPSTETSAESSPPPVENGREQDVSAFFDAEPAASFILSRDGIVLSANAAAVSDLATSYEQLDGSLFAEFVAPPHRAAFNSLLRKAFLTGERKSDCIDLLNGSGHALRTMIAVAANHAGTRCRLIACPLDGSAHSIDAAGAASEEQFHAMANAAPVLIWIADADGKYVWFNRTWLDFTGRSMENERGLGWIAGVHPDDQNACIGTQQQAFATQQAFTLEYRLRDRNGAYQHVLVNGAPRMSDTGTFIGYIGSCTDISAQRQSEEALQHSRHMLRRLVSYQERVREDERKRIAREIHDDLGQNLLALRLDASMLHKRTAGSHPRLHHRLTIALEQIDATMKAVRAAINNLRPSALDLGLNAAIEWQVQEFKRRSGIDCELELEEEITIDDVRATALFRILQESLSNVQRHAQASRVSITLRRRNGQLQLGIEDNGIGLYPDCRRKANSFGLIGIEERIQALGGQLYIDSDHAKGTKLSISIPLA